MDIIKCKTVQTNVQIRVFYFLFLCIPRLDATTCFRFWTETLFHLLIDKLLIVGKIRYMLPKVFPSSHSTIIFVDIFCLTSMELQKSTHSVRFLCNVKVPAGQVSLYFNHQLVYCEKWYYIHIVSRSKFFASTLHFCVKAFSLHKQDQVYCILNM